MVAASVMAGGVVFSAAPGVADGTETLGDPSIAIAAGTGAAVGGTGMEANRGTIRSTCPPAPPSTQVIAYWEGQHEASAGAGADNAIVIDGVPVTGTLIGGPDLLLRERARPTAPRCSARRTGPISPSGLVPFGDGDFAITGMDFDHVNDGVGHHRHLRRRREPQGRHRSRRRQRPRVHQLRPERWTRRFRRR